MPGKERPSQQRPAKLLRERAYRSRLYERAGAAFPCPHCPMVLPSERGRAVHIGQLHSVERAA